MLPRQHESHVDVVPNGRLVTPGRRHVCGRKGGSAPLRPIRVGGNSGDTSDTRSDALLRTPGKAGKKGPNGEDGPLAVQSD